jgi:hypothetical protein
MSDDDLIDECVKSLAKIHNYSFDKVNKLLLKGVVKRWDMDENALGAFTMFNPFQVNSNCYYRIIIFNKKFEYLFMFCAFYFFCYKK